MIINDKSINVTKIDGNDYICLTDMARSYGADRVIENWLRNKNTVEFLGVWERLNNQNFNLLEFEGIKSQAGLNRFAISVKEWSLITNAKGLIARTGRYGGTYAHKDIAFEFGAWLSPEFKLLIISEFQRLKATEQKVVEWDSSRYLSRVNYRLHTDSIKNNLLPALQLSRKQETLVYIDEADILNKLIFGQSATEWRRQYPELVKSGKNQRDYGTIQQLTMIANLETLNAHFLAEKKSQLERIHLLAQAVERQYQSFIRQEEEQRKLMNSSKNQAKE